MSTVIKQVERKDIILDDCEVAQFSWKIFALLLFIIGISITYLYLNQPITAKTGFVEAFLSVLAMFGVLGGVAMIMLGGYNVGVPGYSVRILGEYGSEKYIMKTTPDQDKKTICKLSNELESRARELSKKERELERIAQGCK